VPGAWPERSRRSQRVRDFQAGKRYHVRVTAAAELRVEALDLAEGERKQVKRSLDASSARARLVCTSATGRSAQVQREGDREVNREIELYNLDVIISVGYRVKSHQGTQFRIWAAQRLREYLIKGSNTGAGDLFGTSVALTADGATLAVGALLEASAASGIDGNQCDDSTPAAGAVYMFARNGSRWSQQTYIKASNPDTGDGFGSSLALSADSTTLAVGAATEGSAATGINGDQGDNSGSGSECTKD